MQHFIHLLKKCCAFCILLACVLSPLSATAKLVIAQGGSSGYLMEHTLPSVAMAVAMDADIIKIDTILTADNEVIVHGSPYLGKATNVAEIFPDKMRGDGLYYALDFTLEEIRQLSLHDPAKRFPQELKPGLKIPTLEEELSLIKALNRSLGKSSLIAVEIKQAWLHRKEGKDPSKPVLSLLKKYGYTGKTNISFLLSYDSKELKRIRKLLLPEMGMQIKLVQLIESNDGQETKTDEWGEWSSYNYDWMFSKSGLRSLAVSVAAIGLPKSMLVDSKGKLLLDDFVKNAQLLGTMVFTFPVQKDTPLRVPFLKTFDEELEFFYFTAGVDGIITDFSKDALHYLNNRAKEHVLQVAPEESVSPSVEIMSDDPLQLTNPVEVESKE